VYRGFVISSWLWWCPWPLKRRRKGGGDKKKGVSLAGGMTHTPFGFGFSTLTKVLMTEIY
jgi:hypothetical protein